jgi:hypothetical protein
VSLIGGQNFYFVDNCPALLISTFKDKNFDINKKEIHKEMLYRRVYEIDRFEPVVKYFIEKVKDTKETDFLFILRKMCIIDGNPLPLVQNLILDTLYGDDSFQFRYIIKDDKDENAVIISNIDDVSGMHKVGITEFNSQFDKQEQVYILEQLNLEADMCFGRNETCKNYFREIYSCDWLIDQIVNNDIPSELRGKLMKLLTYIYIDDEPHKLIKLTRAFKAYEPADEYIVSSSSTRSNYIYEESLSKLFNFIREYINSFASYAKGDSHVKSFEMELIR